MATRPRNLLGFIAFFAAAVATWRLAIAASTHWGSTPLQRHAVFAALVCATTIALVALALRLHGQGPRWLGMAKAGAFRAAATGLLSHLVPASIALAACLATGMLSLSPQVPAMELLFGILTVAALVFASEALPEELLFRGYAWARLSGTLRTWQLIVAQAGLFVLFALLVGAVRNPLDASFLFCFGFALGVLRAATQSLWAPIAFHLAFMTAQQATGSARALFSVGNPEMLQTVVMAMVPFSAAIIWLHRRVDWTGGAVRKRVPEQA
ncbi:CPBP family intramembrane glutamic endopeptidase [Pseudoxanthomonas putridarboris]|uniref:CPBP family intramembrane glutamic endopeptidase n=1 Tax=Pseudoxanthomonas putridarboris TaxID=752605 RepID=A0ABU9J4F6_9GAMM